MHHNVDTHSELRAHSEGTQLEAFNSKGQVMVIFDVFFVVSITHCLTNSIVACDLKCRDTHVLLQEFAIC